MEPNVSTNNPLGGDAFDATSRQVQSRLADYRRDLYCGRGAGISDDELLKNTSLRSSVGGIPTAFNRECLHVRTMRMRGKGREADAEAQWAESQFHR